VDVDCGFLPEYVLCIGGTVQSPYSCLDELVLLYFETIIPLLMKMLLRLRHTISACAQ